MRNFQALGAPPPEPRASGGFAPRPPKQPSQLRISGYAHATLCTINILVFLAFVLNNFFLIVQLQTL